MAQIVVVSTVGNTMHMEIKGFIDETMNALPAIDRSKVSNLVISCANIQNITSMGILKWIQAFDQLRGQGLDIAFEKCSPVVVRTASMINKGFLDLSEVRSILIPYYCTSCEKAYSYEYGIEEMAKNNYAAPVRQCEVHSEEEIEFDEVEDVYFSLFKAS